MSDDSLSENGDIAELVEGLDIENRLKNTDLRELLVRTRLEAALGEFGALVGREIGAVTGRKLGAALGSTESDLSNESANNDTEDGSTGDASGLDDSEKPETREDLEELSYRELQSLARDTDVKGNLPRDEMTEQLAKEFRISSG
jgi:hypothetical protein